MGNLTGLDGQTMKGAFKAQPANTFTPGFPGFGPISASQTLAYIADMQETGVPVTYGYISDAHEKKNAAGSTQTGCSNSGTAQGPGDSCYEQNLMNYNTAFTTFFKRLTDDGITPANTLFIITADEGDHFAGANANRVVQPTCTTAPPVGWNAPSPGTCSYPSGKIGEMQVDVHGLLIHQESNSTPFYNESQATRSTSTGSPGRTMRRHGRWSTTSSRRSPTTSTTAACRRTSRSTWRIRRSNSSCTS
jgi:hypothetical protein